MINIAEAATRKIGPLPAFAWGGIVGGGILAFKMLRGDSGGGGASSAFVQPVGGPGMDFEGGSVPEGPPTTTPATPIATAGGTAGTVVNTPATTYRLSLLSHTSLFNTAGKILGFGNSGTYTATIISLHGKRFYRFLRKNKAGNMQWTLVPVGTKTVRALPNH